MKLVLDLFLGSMIVFGSASGQVCCSLVGAIEHGGGASSIHWGTHWPSLFDNRNHSKWVVGFNSTYTNDENLRVRYGTALNAHFQVSHYLTEKSIGYFQGEGSLIRLEESLSFDQGSSNVQQLGLRVGVRQLLTGKLGFVFGEYSLPGTPKFSNPDFAFISGAVPSITLGWTNRYPSPWVLNHPSFLPDAALSISYSKNLKERNNVFMDDGVKAHISSSIFTQRITLSPFASLQSQKLLAPLSLWDEDRQSRWLSVINLGMDLTVNHHKWNWVHIRVNLPVYRWTSGGNFPDGTEPVFRMGLSFTKGGQWGK